MARARRAALFPRRPHQRRAARQYRVRAATLALAAAARRRVRPTVPSTTSYYLLLTASCSS
eukprot:scaffold81138_cov24-Phaeocystis_antarctica.AAC.1